MQPKKTSKRFTIMPLLKEIANIRAGLYLNSSPTGTVSYLQIKDLLMDDPEKTAVKVEYKSKMDYNMVRQGDLLFAGKGTSYLCTVFEHHFPAVVSTSLYVIHLIDNRITSEYLCWYLNHPTIVSKIKASQIGSSTPLILKSTLENLEVPMPVVEIQYQVVAIASLQKKEEELMKAIHEKKNNILNHYLLNKITTSIVNH